MAKRPVELHLSSVPTGHRGALLRQGQRLIIYLDLYHAKREEDVVATMAHELAHYVVGSADHGEEWQQQLAAIMERLTKAMEESNESERMGSCSGAVDPPR